MAGRLKVDDVRYELNPTTGMLSVWVYNDAKYYEKRPNVPIATYDFGRHYDERGLTTDCKAKLDKGLYGCLVTQVVQVLQQIKPHHRLQRIGLVAALSFVIARLNHGNPFLPRDYSFDLSQKLFFLRPHLRQLIAECGNRHLFIHTSIISYRPAFCFFYAVLP